MILGVSLVLGFLFALADVLFVLKSKNAKSIIHTLLRDTLLVFLFHFGVMKYIFNTENIYFPDSPDGTYIFNTLAICFGVGAVYFLINAVCAKYPLGKDDEIKRKKGNRALKIISSVLFGTGVAALTATVWGKDFFGDLTPDQILINLNSPTEGTDASVYISGVESVVLATALFTALFCIITFSDKRLVMKIKEKK